MKRISVIFLSLILTAGTAAAPVSYVYGYGENGATQQTESYTESTDTQQPSDGSREDQTDGTSAEENTDSTDTYQYGEDDTEKDPSVKDTSWFDYNKPKKSYTISTEGQLIGLASLVNEEQTDSWKPERTETFKGVTFTLTDDIELTKEWTPAGSDKATNFAGIFDGNGHTISGLRITENAQNTGLFGYLVGEVRNLTVEGKIKISSGSCGAIAGILTEGSKVTGCTSKVTISAGSKTGGIAGYSNAGTIEKCTNLGSVSGTFKIGGIVGENWGGSVTESRNMGEITSSERGVATYGTGGVAGRSVSASAILEDCYNAGTINSNTEATGGVAGYVNASGSTVKNCYNTGSININSDKKVDKKTASKSASKNSAKNAKQNNNKDNDFVASSAGGIAGIAGVKGVKIYNCYNTAEIKNADICGGVIGSYLNEDDDILPGRFIRNNYYVHEYFKTGTGYCDKEGTEETAKLSTSVSSYSLINMSSALGSAYMKDPSNLYGNNGYPVLSWQQPISDDERTYLSDVSRDLQKKLDKYMLQSSKKHVYGQTVVDIFNPENFTSSALVKYIEAKDKKDNQKEE